MANEARSGNSHKRKNPYMAGIAALNFKPDFDWEPADARTLFERATFPFPVDIIHFRDCVQGMSTMPAECVELSIADPPFGIEFDGRGSQYNRKNELVATGYHEVNANYDEFTCRWIREVPRIMKSTASAFIFSGRTNLKD